MLPPAPSVVVGATVVKRFPGYGVHRGTIADLDIDGGKVLVHWSTTDERTAIRRAGLEGRRRTNPVVDGQLVPRVRNSPSQGRRRDKRRRDEPAATPSPRARRRYQ